MTREGDLSAAIGQAPAPTRLSSPSSATVDSTSYLYLYAILEAGTIAHHLLDEQQFSGLQAGEPLFALETEGLVAAVSRVSAAQFEEEALNQVVADISRLAPLAVRHEEAVRTLARVAPALIPMHFGTVYRNPEGIAALLQERASDLRGVLRHVHGAQEWGLKLFAEQERLASWVAEHSSALREADAAIASSGPGRAYLLRKRRERLVAPEIAAAVERCAQEILEQLEPWCRSVRRDAAIATQPEIGPLLFKASLLVPASQVDALRAVADDLARACRPRGLRLELTGPWAPYSFVDEA